MELFELGKQYEVQAQYLHRRIHQLTAAAKNLNGNDLIIMKRRILSLYADAAECRRCAAILINYREETTYEQNNLQFGNIR